MKSCIYRLHFGHYIFYRWLTEDASNFKQLSPPNNCAESTITDRSWGQTYWSDEVTELHRFPQPKQWNIIEETCIHITWVQYDVWYRAWLFIRRWESGTPAQCTQPCHPVVIQSTASKSLANTRMRSGQSVMELFIISKLFMVVVFSRYKA